MAATYTQAQALRADPNFQGRVRVAMGITARNILGDPQQPQRLRQFAIQIIQRPGDFFTPVLDYTVSRIDLLAATEGTTTDANLQAASDAALAIIATSL